MSTSILTGDFTPVAGLSYYEHVYSHRCNIKTVKNKITIKKKEKIKIKIK